MKTRLLALAVLTCSLLFQSGNATGEAVWTSYIYMNDNYSIGPDGDHIWAGNSVGLFRWNIPAAGEDATYESFTDIVGKQYYTNSILILEDVRWFAVEGMGLLKYQDDTWTVYSSEETDLPNNWIWDIDIDDAGNIWLATSSGVSKFDGTNWTNYTTENGLLDNFVSHLEIDTNNVVWCTSWSGLSCFTIANGTWTTYTTENSDMPENALNDIAVDSQNTKWFTTGSSGLVSFDGTNWNNYTTENGLPTNNLGKIRIDTQGKMWIGTYQNGVFSYDLSTVTTYTTANGLLHNNIYDIAIGDDGTVWLATQMGINGLKAGNPMISIYEPDGPASNYINCAAVDQNNLKWFGSTDNGISTFDGVTWGHYSIDDGIPGSCINDITMAPDGTIWIATQEGAASFDGSQWTTYTAENSQLPDNYVYCVTIDAAGAVWFGTSYGTARLNAGAWTVHTSENGLVDNYISTITAVGSDVWMGGYSGISVFDTQMSTWSHYTTDEGLSSNSIGEILAESGGSTVWIGTQGSGVDKLNGTTWTNYRATDGLAGDTIICGTIDPENRKWFGTWDGVSVYDNTAWTTYTEENSGLVNNYATDIVVDADGAQWIATNWGISKLSTQTEVIPPAAPANFTAGDISEGESHAVRLSWTLSGDDDVLSGYTIYRSRSPEFSDPVPLDSYETADDIIEAEETTTILIATVAPGITEYDDLSVPMYGETYYYWIASVDSEGTAGEAVPTTFNAAVAVGETEPMTFDLTGNYPNPFNGRTTISFSIPETSNVRLTIYNVTGQKIRELLSGKLHAGQHSVVWDGCNNHGQLTSSGVYITRLEANGRVDSSNMLFMK